MDQIFEYLKNHYEILIIVLGIILIAVCVYFIIMKKHNKINVEKNECDVSIEDIASASEKVLNENTTFQNLSKK